MGKSLPEGEVTRLLVEAQSGNSAALNELVPLVYNELRRIASAFLQREYHNQTLVTSDLVHEAFLKLTGQRDFTWENRAHFFGIAANSMRQILVDYARMKKAEKRGHNLTRVTLDEQLQVSEQTLEQAVVVDEALKQLEQVDKRLARIVELRFFTGLTVEETAEALGISPRTAYRDWELAKAWLHRAMTTP